MMTLFALIIWIVFSIAVGIRARHRNRSLCGWLFLSLLISPLLTIILVFVLPEREPVYHDPRIARKEAVVGVVVVSIGFMALAVGVSFLRQHPPSGFEQAQQRELDRRNAAGSSTNTGPRQ